MASFLRLLKNSDYEGTKIVVWEHPSGNRIVVSLEDDNFLPDVKHCLTNNIVDHWVDQDDLELLVHHSNGGFVRVELLYKTPTLTSQDL